MTDYTKLIERLREYKDYIPAAAEAADAIEALQAERDEYQKAADKMAAEHKVERDALQSQLDAMGKGEPIYQYQMGDGSWIDQTKHSYDYNRNHAPNAVVRIVYAAPKALAPLTQPEVVEAFCNTPHSVQYVSVFDAGVRFAEKHHGIGGTP